MSPSPSTSPFDRSTALQMDRRKPHTHDRKLADRGERRKAQKHIGREGNYAKRQYNLQNAWYSSRMSHGEARGAGRNAPPSAGYVAALGHGQVAGVHVWRVVCVLWRGARVRFRGNVATAFPAVVGVAAPEGGRMRTEVGGSENGGAG